MDHVEMPVDDVQAPVDDMQAPVDDVDMRVLDALEAEVRDVERALARLDDGSYGTCEVCREQLPEAQLTEAPAARFCRAHLPLGLG